MINIRSHSTKRVISYLLAKRILLSLGDSVIVVESLLENRRRDTHLLGKRLPALKALHQPTANIVLAVPLDLRRCLTVEDEADGILCKQCDEIVNLEIGCKHTFPFSHILPVT